MTGLEADAAIAKLRGSTSPVKWSDFISNVEVMLDAHTRVVARLEALETRLAEAEAKGVVFKGTFSRGIEYRRGDLVSRAGSTWLALRDDPGVPGADADRWLMVAKSGARE